MKARIIIGVAGLAAASLSQAQIFGAASGYNVFTFGNYTSTYSDTEGRMAVGGNASLTGYDVGMKDVGGNALVVKGNLSFFQGTIRGNAVVGGTSSISSASFTNGGASVSGSPINFSTAESSLLNLSAMWKGFGNTGTVSKPYSTIELRGSKSGSNVFNVSASMLTGASDINIIIPNGASALINLTGTGSITLPNFGYNVNGSQDLAAFRNVIWHATDASGINMNSVNGTLFAPKAAITGGYGALNGQLIAKSFNGPTQMNHNPYSGSQPVPEPATMTLLAAGAGAWLLRRKKAKA